MAFVFPKHSRDSNGLYGPTARQHFYKPLYYHRPTAEKKAGKTRWCIKEGEEYEVFRIADEPWWACNIGRCLFSIVDGGTVVLGEDGERLAKFDFPQNNSDPWHGYPVFSDASKPTPALLDQWEDARVIPYHVRMKIERGKL
jgi:hypothetical protein